jgi:hypothetical protein
MINFVLITTILVLMPREGKTANYVIEIPCHIVPWGWWHDGCCQSSEVKKFKAPHPEYL